MPKNVRTPKFAGSFLDPIKSVMENDSREEDSSSHEEVKFFFLGKKKSNVSIKRLYTRSGTMQGNQSLDRI